MTRTLSALAIGLLFTLIAAGSALAWGDRIQGRPRSFEAGGLSGVYFWHEADDGLHIRTTDPENIEHYFTGTIATDGNIRDLDLVRLENDDTASIDPSGHSLTFSFHTYAGVDGLNYSIDGGTEQVLSLQLDGRSLSPVRVFLGEDSVHPDNDPFTLLRNP